MDVKFCLSGPLFVRYVICRCNDKAFCRAEVETRSLICMYWYSCNFTQYKNVFHIVLIQRLGYEKNAA